MFQLDMLSKRNDTVMLCNGCGLIIEVESPFIRYAIQGMEKEGRPKEVEATFYHLHCDPNPS